MTRRSYPPNTLRNTRAAHESAFLLKIIRALEARRSLTFEQTYVLREITSDVHRTACIRALQAARRRLAEKMRAASEGAPDSR